MRRCLASARLNCEDNKTRRSNTAARHCFVGKIYLFLDLQVDSACTERDVSAPRGRDEADANTVLILHRDGRPASGQRNPGASRSVIAVDILKRLKMVILPRSGRPGDSDFA